MDSDTLHYAIAPHGQGVRWSVWYPSDDASSHIRAVSGRGSQRCVHPASSASNALKVMCTLGARLVDKSVCAGVSGAHGEDDEAAAGEGAEQAIWSMEAIHNSILGALTEKLTKHAISNRVKGIFSMIQHGHLMVMNDKEISEVKKMSKCPTMEKYAKFALEWATEHRRCIILTHEILKLKEQHKSEREVLKRTAMELAPNTKHAGTKEIIDSLKKRMGDEIVKATRHKLSQAIAALETKAEIYGKTMKAHGEAKEAQKNFDILIGIHRMQQELKKLLPGPVTSSQDDNKGTETETNACKLLLLEDIGNHKLLTNAGIKFITKKSGATQSIDLSGAKMEFDAVQIDGQNIDGQNIAKIYEIKSNPTAIFGDMSKIEKLCDVLRRQEFHRIIFTTTNETTHVKAIEQHPVLYNATMNAFATDPWGEISPLRYIAKWQPSDDKATIDDELFFPPSLRNHLCEIVRNECWDELKDYVHDLAYAQVTIKTLKESKLDIFDIGKEKATKLCSAASKDDRLWLFEHLYKVDSIDLAKGVLSGEQIIRLCNLLCKHHLQYLDLSDTELGDVGAKQIAGALPKLEKLKYLDLSHNYIREEGAVLIARALPFLKKLEHLGLSDTNIGEAGAVLIAEALPCLKNLRHLNLSGNLLGKFQGVLNICEALPKLKKLEHLDLSGNLLGNSKGVFNICAALPELKNLRHLDLSSNSIETYTDVFHITEALTKLLELQHLNLSENRFRSQNITNIVDAALTLCKLGGKLEYLNLKGENFKPEEQDGICLEQRRNADNMTVVLGLLHDQLCTYLKSHPDHTEDLDCWTDPDEDESDEDESDE